MTVRNQEQQAQDISTLSHDTENANGHISKIFDKDKIEQDQAFSQALGDAAIQTINNIGQQMQLNAREDAYNKLAGNEQFLKLSSDEQAKMINADPDYIKAQKSFAIGSPFWTAGTAISGALAGLAGGNTSQMLAGGLAPYLALAVKKATTDENNNVNMPANIAGHALAGAVVAYLQGGSVAGGAAGAAGGELAAHAIMAELYPNSTVDSLTNEQKANISALSTLAGALAGGVAGNSSNAIGSGAVAGKVAVENNALNSQDEKQRQDAKWSLPYLEGKKKEDAEKLVAELDEKSRAFDVALGAACQNLSSAACNGMRQELASMAKSYDKQLDGQYIGNMRSVYQDGAKQVDAQMWQYATADAKAEREANVTRLAENWGVSRETADKLYTTMAGIHTAAAIGGAVYGMKGVQEPGAAPSKPVGNDAIKESATSGRSPAPAPGNLAGDEEAGVWSQYDKYRKDQYNWNWPEKLGFAEEPIKTILPVGTRLDRYGEPSGSFLAPKGTPYGERALAPGAKAEKYYEYEVLKPLPVMQGKIAPAFGEPGGGIQILPNMKERVNVDWLIKNEYIREVH